MNNMFSIHSSHTVRHIPIIIESFRHFQPSMLIWSKKHLQKKLICPQKICHFIFEKIYLNNSIVYANFITLSLSTSHRAKQHSLISPDTVDSPILKEYIILAILSPVAKYLHTVSYLLIYKIY